MTAIRIRTAGIAACFVLTSCGQGGGPLSGGIDSDVGVPLVDSTIRHAPNAFDDGLAHLVVTPVVTSASQSEDVSMSAVGGDDAGSQAQDRLRVPDDQVGLVPSDAVLVFRDGIPGYINELGRFVALTQASVLSDGLLGDGGLIDRDLTDSDQVDIDPLVEELLADPSVQSVLPVGDGSYGVITSDPSTLDSDRFDSTEDIVLGFFEEPYEQYQWALNNTGTNLDGALSSPPPQTEGSDVDGREALALASGAGVVVAVIDSGVDFTHPDLADSSWLNTGEICGNGVDDDANGYVDDCRGWDFGYNDNTSYNSGADAHGTHVAGIITANVNSAGVAGIAPDAKVMDLNVGGPGGISGTSIAGAVRYAADNGADIINMSLGTQLGTPRSAVAVIESAVAYALEKDVLVVVAAGNDGVNLDISPVYPASLALPGMLVVGASTPSDERASFSNYSESQVNVFAPGHYILSTMPGNDYQFMSGTSQASPLSAGAAALVMQQYPSHSPSQVIEQLSTTSNVLASLTGLAANGGRINALNAIEGTTPEVVVPEPTELAVSVSGLVQATNELAAEVTIAVPSTWFADPYHWELTVLMSVDDATYALAEFPLVVGDLTATTDGRGAVRLGEGGSLEAVDVAAGLPSGSYSFVIEAVSDVEPDIRFGDAHVVSFSVSPDVVASDPPAAGSDSSGSDSSGSDSSGSDEGASTPTEPGSGAPQPGSTAGTSDGDASGGGSSTQPPTTSGAATDTGSDSSGGATSGGTSSGGTTSGGTTSGGTSSGGSTSGGGSSTSESGETTDVGPGGASAPSNPGPDNDGATSSDPDSSESGSTNPNVPAAGSDQAEQGEWSVYRFSNQVGLTNVVNVVYLMGEFPSQPDVWFGEQPGSVIYYSPEFIIVETPVRSDAGIVDVTLRRPGTGVVLTLTDSFGFVDSSSEPTSGSGSGSSGSDSSGPDSSGTGPSSAGSDTSGGGSSESASPGSDSPTTTAPDSNDSDSDTPAGGGQSGPGTTVPPSAPSDPTGPQSRSGFGDPVDLPGGLRGVPLVGDDPTSGVTLCSADPCRAT